MSINIKTGYKYVELDKNKYGTIKYKLIAVMLFFREIVDMGFDCAYIDGDFEPIIIDGIATSNIIEATLLYLRLQKKEVDIVKNINKDTNESIEFWDLGEKYAITYPYEYGAIMDIVLGINCNSDRCYDTVINIEMDRRDYGSALEVITKYINRNMTPVDAYSIKELGIEIMVCEKLTFMLSLDNIYIIDFFSVYSNRKVVINNLIKECELSGITGFKQTNSISILK